MPEIDTLIQIGKIENMRSYMESYNAEFIKLFEAFLAEPTLENIMKAYEYKQGPVARSSDNSYKHISNLHLIVDTAVREMTIGYPPVTGPAVSYREAIDNYRKLTLMLRRYELMNDEDDADLVREAGEYIREHEVSPVAIHDIIDNDICFADKADAAERFAKILRGAGREKDAILLERM